MNANSDEREKRKSVRTARLFLIGMGLVIVASLTYLLVTAERRPWDAGRVLILAGFYGVGLAAIGVGSLAGERTVAGWVGEILETKPDEILNPSTPAERPESPGRTAAKFVGYILLYGIVFFLASFGARFLIDEGKIVLGLGLLIAALVTVGVWRLVAHREAVQRWRQERSQEPREVKPLPTARGPSLTRPTANLRGGEGLRRVLEVRTSAGLFLVEYQPGGLGSEEVRVNGEVAVRKASTLWFVPRFEFPLGPHQAVVEVRVWLWLAMRAFWLEVDGEILYAEGRW